jgi:hypothetical protein
MAASSAMTWFWSDWLGDQAVRRLTPAERGVWIDLIGLAAVAQPIGYVCDDRGTPLTDSEIARVTNAGSAEEVGKLIAGILEKGAASRDRTGRIYNRRMVRNVELKRKRAEAGKLGGDATALKYFPNAVKQKNLPQHVPKHVRMRPSIPKDRTSVPGTARARDASPRATDGNTGDNGLGYLLKTGYLKGSKHD